MTKCFGINVHNQKDFAGYSHALVVTELILDESNYRPNSEGCGNAMFSVCFSITRGGGEIQSLVPGPFPGLWSQILSGGVLVKPVAGGVPESGL